MESSSGPGSAHPLRRRGWAPSDRQRPVYLPGPPRARGFPAFCMAAQTSPFGNLDAARWPRGHRCRAVPPPLTPVASLTALTLAPAAQLTWRWPRAAWLFRFGPSFHWLLEREVGSDAMAGGLRAGISARRGQA